MANNSLETLTKQYPYPSKNLPYLEFNRRQTGYFLTLAQGLRQRPKKIAEACLILSVMIEGKKHNDEDVYILQSVINILLTFLPTA